MIHLGFEIRKLDFEVLRFPLRANYFSDHIATFLYRFLESISDEQNTSVNFRKDT